MDVTVIGGSFAGLAAATRLAAEGHRVTVVEREPQLGGIAARRAVSDGDPVEPAPDLHLGCHRAARDFLERIGATALPPPGRLEVAFVDREAKRPRERLLRASGPAGLKLPAPLDRLGALAGFGGLSFLERGLALRVALALAGAAPLARLAPAPLADETVDAWLGRLSQSANARRALWHPLARVLLQDSPHTASARTYEAALRAMFLGRPEDAALALPQAAAAELWVEPARRFLAEHGGTVRLGVAARRLAIQVTRDRLVLEGIELDGGEVLRPDAAIAAIPPAELLPLVSAEARGADSFFAGLGRLRTAPALTAVLSLDGDGGPRDLVALLGSPFHWILRRRDGRGSRIWLRAFAAHDLTARSDEELLRLAEAELRAALPEAMRARVHSAHLLRDELHAHPAGGESDRPRARSPVEGLFLAGPHVRTGLPAGLESAARSADEAARLSLEYEPVPPPAPPPGFIPVNRLVRRSPAGPN